MKAPHERGELGAWLVEQRKRLGEERGARVTQKVVVAELAEQGYPIDDSYYRAIESGAKKTAGLELREALGRYFGRTPPSPSARRSSEPDLDRLVTVIEAQTAALNELVATLRDQRPVEPQDLGTVVGAAIATQLRPLLDELRADRRVGT